MLINCIDRFECTSDIIRCVHDSFKLHVCPRGLFVLPLYFPNSVMLTMISWEHPHEDTDICTNLCSHTDVQRRWARISSTTQQSMSLAISENNYVRRLTSLKDGQRAGPKLFSNMHPAINLLLKCILVRGFEE